MRTLTAFHHHERVGTLSVEGDDWNFGYDSNWAASPKAFDLSPALPKATALHADAGEHRPVRQYFGNLLPEEVQRELIEREANVETGDDFALLAYLGAETTGALTFRQTGEAPLVGRLDKLTNMALNARVKNAPSASLNCHSPQKIGIAGAQHKLPLVFDGTTLWEPSQAESSTHIVKCNHRGGSYPSSAFNEFLTMRLAGALGLEVPEVHRCYLPEPLYVVRRFDRTIDERGNTQRTHVIDGCQLLNLDAAGKYASASVGALSDCADLCKDPTETRRRLFQWVVFNVLVGNDDNHLKNLSFHVGLDGIELAPAYDLLCTGAYQTTAFADAGARWPDVSMTIPLPSATTFGQVTHAALIGAGAELGVLKSVCEQEIERLTKTMPSALARLIAALEDENGRLPVRAKNFLGGELRLARTIQHIVVAHMLKLTCRPHSA
jgi:serine/threonine-protein kinase HipA